MKRVLASLPFLFVTTFAHAWEELTLTDVKFGVSSDLLETGTLTITLRNNTQKEIIAWKATVTCLDAFGEKAVNMALKDRSANIKPGTLQTSRWQPNMFTRNADMLKSNSSENFDCEFRDVVVVSK